jgi:hypothetical protein
MNRELTKEEKCIRDISEQINPYDKICPNRHLWSEGFRKGIDYALHLKADEPQASKSAEEILAKCACIDLAEMRFKNEIQIIRPSEALEAMEEYLTTTSE